MLNHFTHPNHPLYEIFVQSEYLCDGCNTLGSGKAYACNLCNFVLHEVCAKCPSTLTSNLHPLHPLVLTRHVFGRFCDLCNEEVRGLYYTCELCKFDLHPLCTQLPKSVHHQVHPQHVLILCPGNNLNNQCEVCRSESDIWSYRCEPCGVAVHLECAFEQGSTPHRVDQPTAEQGQTRGLHHTHSHHGPPGHNANSNDNMGYHYYHYNHMYFPSLPPPPPTYYPVYPPVQIQNHPSGSSGNGRRNRMYKIVGAIATNIATSVVGGFLFPF